MLQTRTKPRFIMAAIPPPSSHNVTSKPRHIARSRANISSACLACRNRKRKCLGGSPCPSCAETNSKCFYDGDGDRRRKCFNDKARATSELQQRLLDNLLELIRSEQCDTTVKLVREIISVDQLVDELDSLKKVTDSRIAATNFNVDADGDDDADANPSSDHEGYTGLLSRPLSLNTSGMPTLPPPLLLPSLNSSSMFPSRRTNNLPSQPPQVLLLQKQPHRQLSSLVSLPSFDELEALTSKLVSDDLDVMSQGR